MDADPAVSADLVLVALDAPRSPGHPPPALPCHVTRAGPPPVGPVRSTPERTKSFFPKRRSVGPEPGRTLFFRIERTGRPAAVRPVSIPFFGSLSTSLTLPGFVPTGKHVCGLLVYIIPGALLRLAFARPPKASIGSFVVYPPAPAPGRTPPRATRSRVPRSQRLRRRRFAPPLRPPDVFVSRRLPLQTASHPRVGTGNVSRPRLRVGLAIPPPTPTPADGPGTHCPPKAASRPAPSAPSVSRPIP